MTPTLRVIQGGTLSHFLGPNNLAHEVLVLRTFLCRTYHLLGFTFTCKSRRFIYTSENRPHLLGLHDGIMFTV